MRKGSARKHSIAIITMVMMLCTLLTPLVEITGSVAYADGEQIDVVENQNNDGADSNDQSGENTGDQTGNQGDSENSGQTSGEASQSGQTDNPGTAQSGDQGDNGENPADTDLHGWVTDETGNTYYYIEDVMQTGLQTIDGSKYYFTSEGVMQTGLQTIDGKLYYFDNAGKATTAKGWTTAIPGGKRYGNGDGSIAAGKQKIGSTWYFFNKTTGTLRGKGFFTDAGNEYYCTGDGKLATGWKAIGNNGFYFYKGSAVMAKNTKVGYLKIPKSGRLGKAYAQGIKTLNKKGWKLKAAYKFSSKKIKYAHKKMRRKTSESYATYGFSKKKGNCFVMASTFYVMAKLLGYDVHQVKGHVGKWCPHSWTVIKQGGKTYVYDPQFKNRTGRNGYKIRYGKKGTWRYNRIKYMN